MYSSRLLSPIIFLCLFALTFSESLPAADGDALRLDGGRTPANIVSMDANLSEFSVLDLDVPALLSEAQSGSVNLIWGDSVVQISLEPSNLWVDGMVPMLNDGEKEFPADVAIPFPFKGHIVGQPDNDVRLTFSGDLSWISGQIANGEEIYIIHPRPVAQSKSGLSEHYVYKSCAVEMPAGICGTVTEAIKSPDNMAAYDPNESTRILKIVFHADAEYYNLDPNGWYSWMIAQVNGVEAIFKRDIDLEFNITGAGAYVNTNNQPVSSLNPTTLLSQLQEAFATAAGPSQRHIVHLISGKNLNGDTLGIARQASTGRCAGYSISQQGYEAYSTKLICAHELAHNLSATHEDGAIEFSWIPGCFWEQYTIMQAAQINPICMMDHFSPANIANMESFDNRIPYNTPPELTIKINDGSGYARNPDVFIGAKMYGWYGTPFFIAIANLPEMYSYEDCHSINDVLPWPMNEVRGIGKGVEWSLPGSDGPKIILYSCYGVLDNITMVRDTVILDRVAPSAVAGPVSMSHNVGLCSSRDKIVMIWNPATDATSGINGYSYSWSEGATAEPDGIIELDHLTSGITSPPMLAGEWYFNIRAIDKAGWIGPTSSGGPYIIDPIAAPTVLNSSADTVESGISFTISWDETPNATFYGLFENGTNIYNGDGTDTSLIRAQEGEYLYELKACNSCGCVKAKHSKTVFVLTPTDVEESDFGSLPTVLSLSQNYPNPFNPDTRIEFALPRSSFVRLEISNIVGRQIRTLVNQRLSAGHKAVVWDGRDNSGKTVSSGIFLYRLETDYGIETKKMVLLK